MERPVRMPACMRLICTLVAPVRRSSVTWCGKVATGGEAPPDVKSSGQLASESQAVLSGYPVLLNEPPSLLACVSGPSFKRGGGVERSPPFNIRPISVDCGQDLAPDFLVVFRVSPRFSRGRLDETRPASDCWPVPCVEDHATQHTYFLRPLNARTSARPRAPRPRTTAPPHKNTRTAVCFSAEPVRTCSLCPNKTDKT